MKIAMLLPGHIDDDGFMEAGYNGLLAIESELGAEISYIDRVEPKLETLSAALRELAETKPDMVIAHGGQNGPAVEAVAREFPDVRFTVVQGAVTGPNVASYEILQEQSRVVGGSGRWPADRNRRRRPHFGHPSPARIEGAWRLLQWAALHQS